MSQPTIHPVFRSDFFLSTESVLLLVLTNQRNVDIPALGEAADAGTARNFSFIKFLFYVQWCFDYFSPVHSFIAFI